MERSLLKVPDMEAIRNIVHDMTLVEAHGRSICLNCKRSIVIMMQEPFQENWDAYEDHGYCPSCKPNENELSPTTKVRLIK